MFYHTRGRCRKIAKWQKTVSSEPGAVVVSFTSLLRHAGRIPYFLVIHFNKCLWHMHSKVCYRKICLCHCFMVIAQTHVQAVATVH